MLIPIGLDQTTVRRLPWVSIAIIALNLVTFAALAPQVSDVQATLERQRTEAMEFWAQHSDLPFPEKLVPGGLSEAQREKLNLLTESMKSLTGRGPDTDSDHAATQQKLDQLVNACLETMARDPFTKWGLVPARPSASSWLTSMFVHAGFLHLIGNLLFFYLSGPFIEDAFGRPLFVLLYLGSGLVANLAHVVGFPHSEVPLIGASGAIAGIMGAFLIRFATRRVKFFYVLFLVRAGTFELPAWIVLPLWLAQQLFFAGLTEEPSGVAYRAHVGGFVFGAVAALLIRQLKIEERFIAPKIESQISVTQHPALEEGLELMVKGDTVGARAAFGKVLAAEPGHPDAHFAIWQSHCQDGTAAQGVSHLARVIDDDLRKGEVNLAFDRWRELVSNAKQGGPPAMRWRLASMLQAGNREASIDVLRSLAGDPNAGELAEKAARQLTALDVPLRPGAGAPAASVSVRAQAEPAVPPPLSAPPLASGPAARPSAAAPDHEPAPFPRPLDVPPPIDEPSPFAQPAHAPPPVAERPPAPAEDVFSLPEAAAAPDGVAVATEELPMFQVEDCTLEMLQEEGLMLRGQEAGAELLPFDEIEKIAIAGISAGEHPYLVVDLILKKGTKEMRQVERLLSNEMDPRRLLGRTDLAPFPAFRELIRTIAVASNAQTLPETVLVPTEKIPTFASVADYVREMLEPAC